MFVCNFSFIMENIFIMFNTENEVFLVIYAWLTRLTICVSALAISFLLYFSSFSSVLYSNFYCFFLNNNLDSSVHSIHLNLPFMIFLSLYTLGIHFISVKGMSEFDINGFYKTISETKLIISLLRKLSFDKQHGN